MSHRFRTPTNPAVIASRIAERPHLWRPLVEYDPTARFYTRLVAEPDHEVWLLTWLPGQATEWHDHGGSAGAFAVVAGVLTEEHAVLSQNGPPRVVPRPRELAAGSLRPFGARHIHRVGNLGVAPAVSVHAYSPVLAEMRDYERVGDLLLQTESRLAGLNW